jgi:hypothetical protein
MNHGWPSAALAATKKRDRKIHQVQIFAPREEMDRQ